MKILELFAGTRSIGKAFEQHGHDVFSVEWDKSFANIDLYEDIENISAKDILDSFGKPDVIWASPDCTTFSIAAISHHRKKNEETGNLDPVSEYAKKCDRVDIHMIELIKVKSEVLVYRKSERRNAKNELDARLAKIHSNVLSIRRHSNETYRHLD